MLKQVLCAVPLVRSAFCSVWHGRCLASLVRQVHACWPTPCVSGVLVCTPPYTYVGAGWGFLLDSGAVVLPVRSLATFKQHCPASAEFLRPGVGLVGYPLASHAPSQTWFACLTACMCSPLLVACLRAAEPLAPSFEVRGALCYQQIANLSKTACPSSIFTAVFSV